MKQQFIENYNKEKVLPITSLSAVRDGNNTPLSTILETMQEDIQVVPELQEDVDKITKHKVYLTGSTLSQSMMPLETGQNTIYVVKDDLTLSEDVTVPANCVLEFEGGSINNSGTYSLSGNNTVIDNPTNNAIFNFSNLGIAGTWNIPEIHSTWFKNLSFDNALKDVIALSNENIFNRIIIYKQSYDYIVSFITEDTWEWALRLNSNTDLILNGVLRVRGNGKTGYRTIFGTGVYNVNISGSGEIIGDYYDNNEEVPPTGKHDFTAEGTHEFCHGVIFYDSKNISVKGLKIGRFPGDSIILSNTESDIINQCAVKNCELFKSRRQGISVIGHEIVIQNNYFHDIAGTSPQSAVDMEPNNNNYTCSNIVIDNNIVENCVNGFSVDGHNGSVKNVIIANNKISTVSYSLFSNGSYVENLQITNNILFSSSSHGIFFSNTAKRATVKNNYIDAEQTAISFYNQKCYNINVENNTLRTGSYTIINCDNLIFKNNDVELVSESSDKYAVFNGDNVTIENNKFGNCWIEATLSNAIIQSNTMSLTSVSAVPSFTLSNFIFAANKYILSAGEVNITDLIRLHDCVNGEVNNNEFNLPNVLKVSQPIWITGNSKKIDCRNIKITGTGTLYYSLIIIADTATDISIEGAYKCGTYSNRPTTNLYPSMKYFATDKGEDSRGTIIIYTGDSTTPWVYADGTAVS